MWDEDDVKRAGRSMCCMVTATFTLICRLLRKASFAAAIVLLVAGCTLLGPKQDQTRFIVLSSATSPGPNGAGSSSDDKLTSVAVGVGPIRLPGYLDRPELVIRTSPNGLELSESDRWAEPLTDNFRHVLANDLANLLGTANIVQFPWYPGTPLDFAVQIQVQRFEADTSRKATLAASWELRTPHNNQVLATRQANLTQPANSLAGDAVAGALSKDVAQLAGQIALAISQAEQQRIAAGGR